MELKRDSFIGLRLEDVLHKKLKMLADIKEVKLSKLIRKILAEYVKEELGF